MNNTHKRLSMLLGCISLTGCFGAPEITHTYQEVLGPNANGCLNGYNVVEDFAQCNSYQVGGVTVEFTVYGSKKYYQDPQRPPYKLSALVCTVERGAVFDFQRDLSIDLVKVSTDSGRSFDQFTVKMLNYNQDCRYYSFTPKLDINVEQDTQVKVSAQVSVRSPETITKSMEYEFHGDSAWYLPFYGP